MRARLGWAKGDTILMRVSATTGNVIMTRVKQAADDDPNTLKDIQGSYNA
jgi:bifunctional DNA-binding transcriptional regulator/antitoxin component of YhaV-PrlF toxin-antitoxin module|tara:strand:+ start:2636 stop:2785 length:150 start_codon:yes stop_codon:yes gene_type:complete